VRSRERCSKIRPEAFLTLPARTGHFPIRILVVDDSTPSRLVMEELLGELGGYEFLGHVSSEGDATDWMQRNPPMWQAVILDLVLQEGSGFNLIGRFKQHHPNGHIVVFSEFASPAVRARCIDLGASAAFRKSDPPAPEWREPVISPGRPKPPPELWLDLLDDGSRKQVPLRELTHAALSRRRPIRDVAGLGADIQLLDLVRKAAWRESGRHRRGERA
jgi:CheY-like chemotaxis protein